jgi:hypothetical protein
MDIKIIFFYRDIEKNVWIELPTGYGITSITKLNKVLYSLKQSPYVWYNTLANFLAMLGFQPLDADVFVFIKKSTNVVYHRATHITKRRTFTEFTTLLL